MSEKLIKDYVYSLNGELGLVSKIVEYTKLGYEVDVDRTYRQGAGSYILVYTKDEEVIEETVVEDSEPEVDINEVVEDTLPAINVDWEYVNSLSESETAKEDLIEYSVSLGVDESVFDKRKNFNNNVAILKSEVEG